ARLSTINPTQKMVQEQMEPHRGELREALGPEPPTAWENQSELDQAVTALLAAGRAGSAAALLERAYPVETRPWEVADRLGTLWLPRGAPGPPREVWEGALAPPRPALRKARVALTHLVDGSFDAARQAFREAMSGDPKLFEAAYGLAVLETDAGRAAEALAASRTAVALAPNDIARSASKTLMDLLPLCQWPRVGLIPPHAGERREESRWLRALQRPEYLVELAHPVIRRSRELPPIIGPIGVSLPDGMPGTPPIYISIPIPGMPIGMPGMCSISDGLPAMPPIIPMPGIMLSMPGIMLSMPGLPPFKSLLTRGLPIMPAARGDCFFGASLTLARGWAPFRQWAVGISVRRAEWVDARKSTVNLLSTQTAGGIHGAAGSRVLCAPESC
ncbi:MAG: tetratricopeptide repeat protein, partial [Singulisphaera sp.]